MVKKKLIFLILIVVPILTLIWSLRNRADEKLFEVMNVPEFELTDQNNHTVTNEDMLGKVYVAEFFFTNCPTICPIMNQNLKEIENEIKSPDLGIVSITIDPKRDTPEVLKQHQQKLQIENPNWHFLTGNRDYIYELSQGFNIYIGKDENTAEGLNHSGKIALIDKKGKIRSRFGENGVPVLYYSGLNYSDKEGKKESLGGIYHPEIEWLKEDVKKLLEEN